MSLPTVETVTAALDTVLDPELRKPITELNMVDSVEIAEGGSVTVNVLLTTEGCPLKSRPAERRGGRAGTCRRPTATGWSMRRTTTAAWALCEGSGEHGERA